MIKKLFLGIFIIVALLAMTGSLFVYFNKDVIVHGIQNHLKQSGLNLQMSDIDVAFIQSFPFVSANINQISLATTASTPLLSAESVSFNLNLSRLVAKEIAIKEIVIRDGHVHLLRDKQGKTNYLINRPYESDSNQSPIELDRIKLINMDFTFRDEKQHHLVRLKDINTSIYPTLKDETIAAQLNLIALGDAMSISQVPYFFNQQITLNSKLSFSNGDLFFQPSTWTIGKNRILFNGEINAINSDQPDVKITIAMTEGKIETLSEFLPDAWLEAIETYDVSGNYTLHGSIYGELGQSHIPKVKLTANISNVKLKHEALNQTISHGESELQFEYGLANEGQLSLPNFIGKYNEENINLVFNLKSFTKPSIESTINGKISLKEINPEIIPAMFLQEHGHIVLKDFNIKSSNNTIHYKGQVDATDLMGMISGIGFEISGGTFDIVDQVVKIAPTKLTALGEQHTMSGTLDLQNEHYDIDIFSENIDLDNFFNELRASGAATTKHVSEVVESNPKAEVNLTANKLSYNHIKFDKTQAKINFKTPSIRIKSKMEYCNGLVEGTATHNTLTGKTTFKAESDQIDMKVLFQQWNDFEQSQIQSKHIKGFGDIQISGSFVYHTDKLWNASTLNVVGGLQIKKGQLHNVPVLQQFSSYIKIKDLSHIKFTSLSNVFRIKNGRFHLPEMFIQSNAANIILAGHQTLDNEINYAIKVNAGQVLTKKFKKHDPKLRPTKAKNKGFFNLHYIVKGPIDNFEYFSSKRRVLDKFEQSLFMRDEIIQQLQSKFEVGDRYVSPHLFQDIPEMTEEAGKVEFLPGFER